MSAAAGDGEVWLLVNPTAGRGRGAAYAQAAVTALRASGRRPRVLQGRTPEAALDLARSAVGEGVDRLVVVGGDGMVHLAAQALAASATALAVLPAGSGEDTARLLGIPRRDPVAAVRALLEAPVRVMDLGRDADGGWFVGVLASGFDSAVNDRANRMRWPTGRSRYNLALLAELGVFRPLHYRVVLDGEPHDLEAMLVAVGNGPSYGGGMRVCDTASVLDGLLDVLVLAPMRTAEFVRVFPQVYTGRHLRHPKVRVHRARTVTIDAVGVTAYADGERVGSLPRSLSVEPGALRVVAPRPLR